MSDQIPNQAPLSVNPEGHQDEAQQQKREKIQVDFGSLLMMDEDEDLDGDFQPFESNNMAMANMEEYQNNMAPTHDQSYLKDQLVDVNGVVTTGEVVSANGQVLPGDIQSGSDELRAQNGSHARVAAQAKRQQPRQIKNFQLPEIFQLDLEQEPEQPWKDASNKSEYFNYGFNQETWKKYKEGIVARKEEVQLLNEDNDLTKIFSNSTLWHAVLDFYLGHDYGGSGEPLDMQKYGQLNVFPETMDLPIIRPKTTLNNKNEFNINIEKTAAVEQADMHFFPKAIIQEWEESTMVQLQEKIQKKKEDLEAERKKYKQVEDEIKKKQDEEKRRSHRDRTRSRDLSDERRRKRRVHRSRSRSDRSRRVSRRSRSRRDSDSHSKIRSSQSKRRPSKSPTESRKARERAIVKEERPEKRRDDRVSSRRDVREKDRSQRSEKTEQSKHRIIIRDEVPERERIGRSGDTAKDERRKEEGKIEKPRRIEIPRPKEEKQVKSTAEQRPRVITREPPLVKTDNSLEESQFEEPVEYIKKVIPASGTNGEPLIVLRRKN